MLAGAVALLLSLPQAWASVIPSAPDRRGAVACESKLCSGIGIGILERGVSLACLCSVSSGRVPAFFVEKGMGVGILGWADHVILRQ